MDDQSTADTINAAIEDKVPSMGEAPDLVVELIRGLYDSDKDVWHTTAEIRELNGEDEEYLAAIQKKKGLLYAEYMNALLSKAVVRIGSLDINGSRGEALVSKLMMADRDLLYLNIVKATYGNEREVKVICSECKTMNDVTLELDKDFPITYPDFDIRQGIEVEISSGTVHLRLPNAEDTVEVNKGTKTDAEVNTAMLARCTIWPKGKAPDNPLRWARSLGMADRRKLVNALLNVEIGPKMEEVNTQCASCDKEMPLLLDWVSLLFD